MAPDRARYDPYLTSDFKDFIAARIVQRFRILKPMKEGVLILDQTLFRHLLGQAFDDATHAGLIPSDVKFGCGITLFLDDDFYTYVRRQTVEDLNLPL